MNKVIVVILLAIVSTSCEDAGTGPFQDLSVLPMVTVSQRNYLESDIRGRVPDSVLLPGIVAAYKGKYSQNLKERLFSYVSTRAAELNFDAQELRRCIESTGQLREDVTALPYLVERARYNSIESWIFELTWGYDGSLGHYRCYVISAAAHDTLLFITCR